MENSSSPNKSQKRKKQFTLPTKITLFSGVAKAGSILQFITQTFLLQITLQIYAHSTPSCSKETCLTTSQYFVWYIAECGLIHSSLNQTSTKWRKETVFFFFGIGKYLHLNYETKQQTERSGQHSNNNNKKHSWGKEGVWRANSGHSLYTKLTSHLFNMGMGRDHNAMGRRNGTKPLVDERN